MLVAWCVLLFAATAHTQSAPAVSAQSLQPAPLDTTTLSANGRAVARMWRAYLESTDKRRESASYQPSPYWLQSEQRQWPAYALATLYVGDDAQAVTVAIAPLDARADSVYRIVARLYPPGWKPTTDVFKSAMTWTVYAVRDGTEWKLSNALPRLTETWKRAVIGPITYAYPPTYTFNRARAERTVAFADSLSREFGAPRLKPITYFVAPSVDEVHRIMGLEYDVKIGAEGGRAQPVNRMLFSGDPRQGEAYRHEIAHLVLAPITSGNTPYFYNEGIATWLGGTIGLSYAQALPGLGQYLREHPTESLDALINRGGPQTQLYRAGALLCAMIFERGGTAAISSLFDKGGSTEEFRTAVADIMKQSWNDVARDWKRRALNAAPTRIDTLWYVTSRRRAHDRLAYRFADSLEFGFYRLSSKADADVMRDNIHMRVLDSTRVDRATFLQSISAPSADANNLVILSVHGYATSHAKAVRDAGEAFIRSNTKARWVAFSWPSNGHGMHLMQPGRSFMTGAYRADSVAAAKSRPAFAQVLADLHQTVGGKRLVVTTHSLGAQIGIEVLTDNPALRRQLMADPLRNVGLFEPDYSSRRLREHSASLLRTVSARVALYASRNDRMLLFSRLLNRGDRAGLLRDGAVAIEGVETIDATDGVTSENWIRRHFGTHHAMKKETSALRDFFDIVIAERPASDRTALGTAVVNAGGVWRLVAKRHQRAE